MRLRLHHPVVGMELEAVTTFRGDPFMAVEDTSDPWRARIDWLQARAHRPAVYIRGEDLRLLLGLYRVIAKQAYLAERHNDRLRDEVARLEAEAVTKHSPRWEPEQEAA